MSSRPATATGFVFEGKIVPADAGKTLGDGTNPMYAYNDVLYENAAAIHEAVKAAPVSNLATAFADAFDVAGDGTVTEKADADLKALGFIRYVPNAKGEYLCYYFSWFRHNDNGDPTSTGIMEYGTVRNNVYKLAVTGIKRLGRFEPGKMESRDVYLNLSIEAKPWIVRINNMEF